MNRAKQEKIFFELYENESDALFRFVFFRVSSREQAQDIVQETFAKFWEVMLSEKIIDNNRAFLFRIASNKVIDYYRKTTEYSLDVLKESGFDAPLVEAITPEVRIDMDGALQSLRTLPQKYQEALWLRSVENWAVKDIAKHLGESVNVVSVRIHRGIQAWRKGIRTKEGRL